jgi:hypothetical protein
MNSATVQSSNTKYLQDELERVTRILGTESGGQASFSHIVDLVTCLTQVCRSAADIGDCRIAVIGIAEQNNQKTVQAIAHAGSEAGYFDSITYISEDEPRGRGPGGIAIRTGKTHIARQKPQALTERGYL